MTWDNNTESCLDDTYYVTFPIQAPWSTGYYYVNSDGVQVEYTQGYLEFQFENCIAPNTTASNTDQCIINFMSYWNQCQLTQVGYTSGNDFFNNCSSITKDNPGSTYLNVTTTFNGVNGCCSNINYAEHCYFWPEELLYVGSWTFDDIGTPSGAAFTSYCVDNCDFTYPSYVGGTCMNNY
jgi:hypothetical protein